VLFVLPFQQPRVLGAGAGESEDPDLPRGVVMDKAAFLHARSENIALLRGVPHFLPYDPRVKALRELEEQERNLPRIDPAFWTQLGPAPIPNGQTNAPQNPVSGRTISIAIHPVDPNIVYVGTAQGGVYRSLDGGTNWTPLFDSAMSLAIGSVALAPSSPTTLYVGTGEPNGSADSFFGVGMYRIDNADTTATLVGPINPMVTFPAPTGNVEAFTGRVISQILVHPTDPNIVFASTYTGTGGNPSGGSVGFASPPLGVLGLYRSTNAMSGSPTFTKLTVTTANSVPGDTSGNRSIRDIAMDPADPNNVIAWTVGPAAAGDSGIYRSTDALAPSPTFTQVVISTTANTPAELTASNAGGVTRMWAATGESNGRVRRSTDAGATWSAPLAGGQNFCNPQCFYDIAIAAHPTTANTLMLGGSPTLVSARSTDGGDTFTQFAAGLHVDTHAIEYAPGDPNIVYFGSDGGIWRSSDGGQNWSTRNNSFFHATQFQSAASHPLDPEYWIGGTQDNGTEFRRSDTTWFRTDGGDGGYALIDQSAVDTTNVTMYHTYFNQTTAMGFARVTTTAAANAMNWNPFFGCGFGGGQTANGLVCPASAILFYAPMALGPGTPNTVYFGSDQLYRSANLGVTMTPVSQVLVSGQAITTIGIAPSNDNVRIAGTRNGRVFATTTGANPLIDVTAAGMPPPNPLDGNQRRAVGRAAIDPTNANVAYVTFGGYTVPAGQHVWKTTNLAGGAGTWAASGSGIPDVPVNAFVIDPSQPNNLYAGTDIGVYASTDGGANWVPYTTGMPRVAVFDLSFHDGTSRVLRAATHGRGLWERTPLPVPVKLQQFDVK
jgi:photosystem II stability/assembly factor-like uncharacterized protein